MTVYTDPTPVVFRAPYEARVLKVDDGARVEVVMTDHGAILRKEYTARPFLLWRTFGQRSRAEREYASLTALSAARVPCVRPLGWTERRVWGCVPRSAICTAFVGAAPDLRGLLRQPLRAERRRELAAMFGGLLRRLHAAGFCSTTSSPRNVLVRGAQMLLCDQPFLLSSGADLRGAWVGEVDLYDAFFSCQRRREWSDTERMRGVLAYFAGDRRAMRRLWRRLRLRSRARHRLTKGLLRSWARVKRPGRQP